MRGLAHDMIARIHDPARKKIRRRSLRHGKAAPSTLTIALDNWEARAAGGGGLFAELLSGFARFYWAHMEKEETSVLPAAERSLSNEDWHDIYAMFESHQDPMFGEDTAHQFRNLFSRIIRLAPPPIGEGDLKH